jgi:hypothetical protein
MNVVQPSRVTFWRFVLVVSWALPFLSIWNAILLGRDLGVDIPSRPSWVGLIAGLFLLGLIPLLVWTLTWSRHEERIIHFFEFPERLNDNLKWAGWLLLIIAFVGYTFVFTLQPVNKLFGGTDWVRLLIFWSFTLIGLIALKMIRPQAGWFTSLVTVAMIQITIHLLAVNFSYVTDYPFSKGWSETSRYYHPSMFFSKLVYGQRYPFPIINPSLHILLAPPYLFDLPLWFHRFWHVALRYLLLAITALVMTNRFMPKTLRGRFLVGLWIFLFLATLPFYFHLTIPVILILAGYSSQNEKRTWLALFLASAWCGLSRINWYPVPAIIAAALYVLETPFKGRNLFQYLWKPALWGIFGMLTAFGFQRLYIEVSGVENINYFYTTLVSDLFWYRLLPSATFPTGILPTAILVSLPIWLVIYAALHSHPHIFHSLRAFLLVIALAALATVGVIVSVKIGGGADIHNMDSYFILLLIVAGYLAFARYQREDGQLDQPAPVHWLIVILLVILPVWSQFHSNAGIKKYDKARTDAIIAALQERVDEVNDQGGEILFITQRQLISLGMLHNVNLVTEYEREDLMEMAMGGNTEYLDNFENDMKDQRFDLIVVDPLKFQFLGSDRSFGEENNVWVRRAMKPILCNYQLDVAYPEDEIALYVPQEGERQCPPNP